MLTHTINGCAIYFEHSFAMRRYVVLTQHTHWDRFGVFGRIEWRNAR